MESGPRRIDAVSAPGPTTSHNGHSSTDQSGHLLGDRRQPDRIGSDAGRVRAHTLIEAIPDEPLAVIAAGPAGAGRRAVLAALLDDRASALSVPRGSFLVLSHAQGAKGAAYVPGLREAPTYRADPANAGPALARPPRRVELSMSNSLLKYFDLVDTPDSGTLGLAGVRIVLDAVRRGGALLFVIRADQRLAAPDLDLLTQVVGEAAVFFAVTPAAGGGWSPPDAADRDPDDTAAACVQVHRDVVIGAVPGLGEAPWVALDPVADAADLRRALVGWGAGEALRRSSANPPVVPGATRTIRVAADAAQFEWADSLDRHSRTAEHRIRQDLALESANIHLRCVRELVFGSGCAGLPETLDQELHALSLRAVADVDAAVDRILDEILTVVFGEVPDEAVRRRVIAAVGWGFTEYPVARDLDRVLLINSAGGVSTLTGLGAVAALPAYSGGTRGNLLPPLGAGLSGACYQHWGNPAHNNTPKARSWLQRALREVELELSREVCRRFEAVQLSLVAVLTKAVAHGNLLA